MTLTDMTERKRAEEQQTMMVAELNHRVKNILAIVQSVAAQTVRSSASLENFAEAFAGRLKALAIAHDILTQTRWIGVGLSELLVAVLAPYRSPDETRVNIAGPQVLLPARAVVPLSMVLHELTTNAAKYGALSTRRGRIDITWQLSRRHRPVGRIGLAGTRRTEGQGSGVRVDGFRHEIDRSRHQPRSRWQDQGRLRSGRRALDDHVSAGRPGRGTRGDLGLRYRIAGAAKTFSQIRRSAVSSNGLVMRGIARNGAGKSVTSS